MPYLQQLSWALTWGTDMVFFIKVWQIEQLHNELLKTQGAISSGSRTTAVIGLESQKKSKSLEI